MVFLVRKVWSAAFHFYIPWTRTQTQTFQITNILWQSVVKQIIELNRCCKVLCWKRLKSCCENAPAATIQMSCKECSLTARRWVNKYTPLLFCVGFLWHVRISHVGRLGKTSSRRCFPYRPLENLPLGCTLCHTGTPVHGQCSACTLALSHIAAARDCHSLWPLGKKMLTGINLWCKMRKED